MNLNPRRIRVVTCMGSGDVERQASDRRTYNFNRYSQPATFACSPSEKPSFPNSRIHAER